MDNEPLNYSEEIAALSGLEAMLDHLDDIGIDYTFDLTEQQARAAAAVMFKATCDDLSKQAKAGHLIKDRIPF